MGRTSSILFFAKNIRIYLFFSGVRFKKIGNLAHVKHLKYSASVYNLNCQISWRFAIKCIHEPLFPHEQKLQKSSFRRGRLFFVTSTTVTTTITTSTLCFTKPSCASQPPFDPPGAGAPAGAAAGASPMGSKMCATGCGCARNTAVMCPTGCIIDGAGSAPGPGNNRCPPGCVSPGPGMVPAGGLIQAIPDPCDRCTVTDSMADMMVATCPGRKKKRAILESALLADHTQISPSPAISQSDFER